MNPTDRLLVSGRVEEGNCMALMEWNVYNMSILIKRGMGKNRLRRGVDLGIGIGIRIRGRGRW